MPRRRIAPGRLRRWLRGDLDPAAMLGLHPEARDDLAWQAHRRLQDGRVEEAERIYRLMEALWPPGNSATRLGLAVCQQARGDLAAAERGYDQVLAEEPGNAYALANRAEVRLLTDRPEAARADLAEALALLDRGGAPPDLRRRLERLRELVGGAGPW